MTAREHELHVLVEAAVVAPEIKENGMVNSIGVWILGTVTEEFRPKHKVPTELLLEQKTGERRILIAALLDEDFPAAPIKTPITELLPEPDGNAIPSLAYAETFVRITSRKLDEQLGGKEFTRGITRCSCRFGAAP